MLRAFLLSLVALFVATCDRSPVSPSARSRLTAALTADDLGGDTTVVLVGAGDIVRCDNQEDEATAALLDSIPGIVFTVGDNVYAQSGILPDFENCYEPSWGRHKARTRPAHGHMESWQPGSTNYYNYFGAAAGEPGKGYYSYDAGAWHVVVLNSDVSLAVGSPQDAWLNADLGGRTKACLLAIWHHPRFSSAGSQPANDLLKPPWEALYAAGASLVVNSHLNVYERFAPQRPDGSLDPDRGIRQFTVGTGGIGFSGFRSPVMPNSEARNNNTHGVLKLTLRPNGYDWQFVPQAGKTFTDAGSGPCFGPAGNLPPVARPGGPYSAENAVTFDGSASSDPDGNLPLSFLWDFGDGATDNGPTPLHAYAAEGAYTVTLTVTDARGGQGMATTTATLQGGPPTVDGGSDVRARPGRVTRLTFAFTDKDAYDGPWSYDVAWGDGAHSTGTATTLGQPIEVSHVYGDAGQFAVPVAVTDKDSATGVDLVTITVSTPGTPEIIAGAGNIASCGVDGDEATAALLDGIPGLVFTLGDNAFPGGSASDYARCYQPSWGRHRRRTRAVQGNHEYHSPGGAPSFAYWGVRAGPAGLGYYSYDVADWHVIVLNDQIAYSTGSTQYQWLQADLAANTTRCTIAMWHVPLFLSSNDSGYIENPSRRVLWNALYAAGVDVVLNAQQHHYERFAPQTPAGALDARGIREFNVGTGGESTVLPTVEIHPNSQVRSAAFGVLKLTLRDGSYSWEFVPVPGETFSDAGSGTCDGEPLNQTPTANAGGPYAADANVMFSSAGSTDPDNNLPLTYAWTFGDGTTASGASPTKTYTTNGTYTATLVVTDALGLASAPASTSVTIANVAPTVNAGADATLELGTAFPLGASFTDPGDAADAPWGWTIAWGDGTSESGSAASPGGISSSHTYAAAGSYAVQVSVTDVDGGTGMDQATVTVLDPPPPPNQAPTANPGGSYAADATVAFDGTGSRDPDNNLPLTYAWDFGDATTGSGATPGHTYATAGSYTVTLVVTDALGLASAPAATAVTIANVAPAVNAGADTSVVLGSPFGLSATFTDAGGTTDAPWAWTVAWGDGTTASGSTNALGGPIAASHSYAAPGAYTVQVTVTDKDGGTGADEAVVTVPEPASVVMVGAGNSTRCDYPNDEQTALLLDGIAGTVFTTGDNVRASGSLTDFQNCYDPTWGRQRSRTRPAAGDLDYQTAGAAGYFSYFGAAAGTAGQGYYSYELGAWHIVVLNSNISMAVGSPQETWLRGDLAAHPTTCVLAYWHHPRFSSYSTAVRPEVKPLWDALYAAGADVVLNGHYRLYERFAPQTPTEVRDDAAGIRQFTVGTGGHGVEPFGTPRPNSEVRESGTYGVLKLTLRATSYDWEFVPIAGQTFTDSGTTACH